MERFAWTRFADCVLEDPFFDSLKGAYKEFPQWFRKKANAGEEALVSRDDDGIIAFVYLKLENEPIALRDKIVPAAKRLKIGTFKMGERYQGQRAGEGAMGVALWRWQETKCDEVYATMFKEQQRLISLFERFGFQKIGDNERGEQVYLRSRKHVDYSDAYTSFPFINPAIRKAGIIPINADFHDRLFQFSELKGTKREVEQEAAGNGMSKVYIATPSQPLSYEVGEPIFIYRKAEDRENNRPYFQSCVTSFATVTKILVVKNNGVAQVSLSDFITQAGNKTIFSEDVLRHVYQEKANVVMLEMAYNGVFGKGHNVIYGDLHEAGLFDKYPYAIEYSREQFVRILEMGGRDAKNIVIDQA